MTWLKRMLGKQKYISEPIDKGVRYVFFSIDRPNIVYEYESIEIACEVLHLKKEGVLKVLNGEQKSHLGYRCVKIVR